MGTAPRDTAQRNRDRARIRRDQPACAICGQPIDYTLPYLDPGEFVVDHIVPLSKGGQDRLENYNEIGPRLRSNGVEALTEPLG